MQKIWDTHIFFFFNVSKNLKHIINQNKYNKKGTRP